MAEGFDTNRFQSTVDQSFICSICLDVLRDPMQCENNEHYFCSCCIKKHLEKTSLSCPVCQQKLTVETLRKAPRIISDFVSRLKINCDHAERGCDVVLELEALPRHVQDCEYTPVHCSNEGCDDVVNRRDVKQHETERCRFKTISCDDCREKMPYNKYETHGCVLRRDFDEMKKDLAAMKSTQHEILKEMKEGREQMAKMTVAIENLTRSCRNVNNLVNSIGCEIFVIGGLDIEAKKIVSSVEKFSLFNQTWAPLPELITPRCHFAAVVFQNQILVCGGSSSRLLRNGLDSIEVFDLNNHTPEWKHFSVNLPVKVAGHKCVVYGNRLLIIGGWAKLSEYLEHLDTIYELLLVPPYSSKLLCRMKKKRAYHGVELFDDKVLIAGGNGCIGAQSDVELFDITRNECVEMPPLPSPVKTLATVRRDDTMLLIGGLDDKKNVSNKVIQYDHKTGKSEVLLVMETQLIGCAAVFQENMLVVIGGGNKVPIKKGINEVNGYNFSSRSWKKLPSMNEQRYLSSAIVVKRDIFQL
ncbi:kelch domain-containing protein 8A-like isoform X1 [Dendronephthya gigantea]|uniref:kelch domain-containing protein 8A-like isoform X1 n=1 Tax=Dendronephthya gigantea TaxID=151771 RepID=UPI0010694DC4|nr:kelch domain-containing protein 8A-like isoform X1 [Dendronephthya gigantea]